MSESAPTTVALISGGLPRHASMGPGADNPVELQRFADYVSTTTLTVEDLLAYADSAYDGPSYEFGDKRVRYAANKCRRFVRNAVGAHFLPAQDLV